MSKKKVDAWKLFLFSRHKTQFKTFSSKSPNTTEAEKGQSKNILQIRKNIKNREYI